MASMRRHGGARPGAGRKSKLPIAIKAALETHYSDLSKKRVITSLAKEHGVKPRCIYNHAQYRGMMESKPQKNFINDYN